MDVWDLTGEGSDIGTYPVCAHNHVFPGITPELCMLRRRVRFYLETYPRSEILQYMILSCEKASKCNCVQSEDFGNIMDEHQMPNIMLISYVTGCFQGLS